MRRPPGAAHQNQRAARSHLGYGVARDLEPQGHAAAQRLAHFVWIHVEQRQVAWTASGHHDVVDWCWEPCEEGRQRHCVVSVEGGGAVCADLYRCVVQPIRIAPGQDDLSSLGPSAPGCFQPDARAAADHHDDLSVQFWLALGDPWRARARHRFLPQPVRRPDRHHARHGSKKVDKSVHKSSDDVGSGLSDISACYGSNTSSGLPPCAGASAK